MQPLDKTLRKQLERTIKDARDIAKNVRAVMTAEDMKRSLDRLGCEILERIPDYDSLALIGIQRAT